MRGRSRHIFRPGGSERHPAALVRAAAGGDQQAWHELVERFNGLVWSVARAHRLGPAEAADVVQTTWLRLLENLDRLREADRVGSWLATTARNECLRVLRGARREILSDDQRVLDERPDEAAYVDRELLVSERDAALRRAFRRLSPRAQLLLRLLLAEPRLSYEEIGRITGMPVGSIGPTRSRCLAQLRNHLSFAGVDTADQVAVSV